MFLCISVLNAIFFQLFTALFNCIQICLKVNLTSIVVLTILLLYSVSCGEFVDFHPGHIFLLLIFSKFIGLSRDLPLGYFFNSYETLLFHILWWFGESMESGILSDTLKSSLSSQSYFILDVSPFVIRVEYFV